MKYFFTILNNGGFFYEIKYCIRYTKSNETLFKSRSIFDFDKGSENVFSSVELIGKNIQFEIEDNFELLELFLSAKQVEGCSKNFNLL